MLVSSLYYLIGTTVTGRRRWVMKFPSKETLERLRHIYSKGTKVCLLAMDDIQAPPVGTKGEVRGVDDAGNILISWENGSSLSLIPGTDQFRILPTDFEKGVPH